jgi:two-component SAPR family response regulator
MCIEPDGRALYGPNARLKRLSGPAFSHPRKRRTIALKRMDGTEPGSLRLEIKLLGPVEMTIGGRRVEIHRRMQRALLAVLALDVNRVVSTDRLIDALWGERPPQSAPVAVYGLVSALRKLLEPHHADALRTREPGYVLELSGDDIDIGRFELLAAEGRRALAAGKPRSPRRS